MKTIKTIIDRYNNKKFLGISIVGWAIVLLGVIVFAAVALWNITKSSIWFDEAFSYHIIKYDFFEIARYTSADVHPPLFYWLLKIWSIFFGDSDIALRSMSVLFGAISIILGFILTNKLFGRKAARMSLIFLILSPMLVRYSQEARMYTLVAAIAMAATLALVYAIESKKRLPWIVYGILISLGMWTHYFMAIIWICHWIWRADLISRTIKKGQRIKAFFSKNWILSHVIAILLYLPWLYYFARQMYSLQRTGFWIPDISLSIVTDFFTNAIYYLKSNEINGWMTLGFIILAILMVKMAISVYKSMAPSERSSYRLILAISLLPVLIMILISLPPMRSSFIDRYVIPANLGLSMFFGITMSFYKKNETRMHFIIKTILVAGLLLIGITNVWYLGNYNKNTGSTNDARGIVENIQKVAKGQPIIANTPLFFYEASFYSTIDNPVYFIEPEEKLFKAGVYDMIRFSDYKISNIDAFESDNPVFWYVIPMIYADYSIKYDDWRKIQQIDLIDPVSGKINYTAIQYEILNN